MHPTSIGPRATRARAGFTILEIMIATAILTLGLVGILALFPVAIHYGKEIVEKSTAVVVAESVAEGIREGIRNNLRSVSHGGVIHHYFVFRHDGVQDPVPNNRKLELPDKDFFILLPRFRPGRDGLFPDRESAMRAAKTFVYPETDRPPNGGNGNAFYADDDGDDYMRPLLSGSVVPDILVEKTYPLGTFLPPDDPNVTGDDILDDQKIEALKQYSYAFEIQGSVNDANLDWQGRRYEPANRLYRVRVMVFRGFSPPPPGEPVPVKPVFELDFEVAK